MHVEIIALSSRYAKTLVTLLHTLSVMGNAGHCMCFLLCTATISVERKGLQLFPCISSQYLIY